MSGVRHGRRGAAGRGARACPHPAALSLWLSAALPGHLLRGLLPLLTIFHLERAEDAARRAGDSGGDSDEPVGTPPGGRDGPPKLMGERMEGGPKPGGRSPQRGPSAGERSSSRLEMERRDTALCPTPGQARAVPPGAGLWETGESARLMVLPPRPLDTAHLAQAVGRCDENQATQLGGEETLRWEEGLDTSALFLLLSMRFSFWLPPINSWHLFINVCRAPDQCMTLVIQTFGEIGFIKET